MQDCKLSLADMMMLVLQAGSTVVSRSLDGGWTTLILGFEPFTLFII